MQGESEYIPPSYGSATVDEIMQSKERLDVQYREIQNHWQLRSIFEMTRQTKKAPPAVLEILRLRMLATSSPGLKHQVPLDILRAKVAERTQALLNVKNMAMIWSERPGFRDSSMAHVIEAMAVSVFYESSDEFEREMNLFTTPTEASAPEPSGVPEPAGAAEPATAPELDEQHFGVPEPASAPELDEQPPALERTNSSPIERTPSA